MERRFHFPDGSGTRNRRQVASIGSAIKKWKVGDRGVVGPLIDSCRECQACKTREEQFYEQDLIYTYNHSGVLALGWNHGVG